jgi:hypothetical protein
LLVLKAWTEGVFTASIKELDRWIYIGSIKCIDRGVHIANIKGMAERVSMDSIKVMERYSMKPVLSTCMNCSI